MQGSAIHRAVAAIHRSDIPSATARRALHRDAMPRRLGADPPLPTVFPLAAAVETGLSADQARYRVASGRWERLARDAYRSTDWAPVGFDAFARARLDHVHRVVAAARRNPDAVVGYESAALLHGLPLFTGVPSRVTLLVPPGQWSGRRSGVSFRELDLGVADIIDEGVALTSPARTWFDIARTRPLSDALSAGDAALRGGAARFEDLASYVVAAAGMRGCRRAAVALEHVDALRESVLESGSWAYFVRHDLPLPRMQVEVRGVGGRLLGRVDFYWDHVRLVGECDGRLKYDDPEALYAEKRREDDLRAAGLQVLRWGWRDLAGPALADRLRARL